MDNLNIMEYWLNSAERDYDTMKVMYENKKEYMEFIFRTLSNRKIT